jgi:hypothetical protein
MARVKVFAIELKDLLRMQQSAPELAPQPRNRLQKLANLNLSGLVADVILGRLGLTGNRSPLYPKKPHVVASDQLPLAKKIKLYKNTRTVYKNSVFKTTGLKT